MKSQPISIHDFAVEQMNRLLTALAFQVHRAARRPGPDEIHDLRVSIRRFSQGLRFFSSFLPKSEVKKVHKALKAMMQLTSSIRDRDITMQYLPKEHHAAHHPRLTKERNEYQRQFGEMVRRWSARDFSAKWRNALSLRGA